ncbi:MAG: reprolysin-like metallopeptidase [Aestuariibacter sp.]
MRGRIQQTLVLLLLTLCSVVQANEIWKQQNVGVATATGQTQPTIKAETARYLTADMQLLRTALLASSDKTLQIPTPSGKRISVTLRESSVLAPALAKKYPQLKSYIGYDRTGNRIGRFSLSQKGFHGMYRIDGQIAYLDPQYLHKDNYYINYYKKDAISRETELFTDKVLTPENKQELKKNSKGTARRTGDTLITYRLAIATTAEYTEYHGNTVEGALAALNTLVTRINEIYETELAVSFQLVAENDSIIYTDAETDPYANDSDGSELDINQTTLDSEIGSANYDIGHLVGTGAGGIASLGSVCTARKAKGLTGATFPETDSFYVDYVAHEIGHQFSGNHSFNGTESSCENRNASTSFEPGSGSTIMGYAGICGSQNIQNNSDPYFHIGSIEEMRAFIDDGAGGNCGTNTTLSNTIPVADAGSDYTIPANTPFVLTGTGTDADNDSINYMWEQLDPNGTASSSPETMVDNGSRPLFRSWTPESAGQRYFPRFEDVLDGETVLGETYPTTTRDLNFRLTIRDNKGGVDSDAMVVSTVASSTGFSVRQPSADNSWYTDRIGLLLWNTAGSESGDIACQSVDVEYSTDSGNSFTTLATDIVNDGIHALTAPSTLAVGVRIRISCPSSIFYTISDGFSILTEALAPVDSDGDGMSDEFEETYNLDPNSASDANEDADNDGLSNLEEYFLGTNPTSADSDGDSIPDQYEVLNRLDPNDSSDANADADGDGSSNLEEYQEGTDPNDGTSNSNITQESFDFESDSGLDDWDFGSVNPWTRTDETASSGSFSMVSADMGDDNSSDMTLTDTFAAGTLSFDYKVSSEEGWDKIFFYVDDEVVLEDSGEKDWQTYTYQITQGVHTLKWAYTKDGSVSNGDDLAWVDNVSYSVNRSTPDTGNGDDGEFNFESESGLDDFDFTSENSWEVTDDEAYNSLSSLGSGPIGHGASSEVTYTNTFEAGEMSFYVKVSSEATFDEFKFYVGDELVQTLSGDVDWTQVTYDLTAGEHRLRWVYSKDMTESAGEDKAWIDDLVVPLPDTSSTSNVAFDFDGDGKADVGVKRPESGIQYIKNSSGIDVFTNNEDGITRLLFGQKDGDIPVPADYDGDGITDIAFRRPSTYYWFVFNSSGIDYISGNSDGISRLQFGKHEDDIPVPTDYDGDGKADVAVRRPSTSFWYIRNSSGIDPIDNHSDGISRVQFGLKEDDIPVPADYDGDGRSDIAVRRPESFYWYILNSSGIDPLTENWDGISRMQWGKNSEDIPVPADYDGDGKADLAVRRPSTHFWYILNSSGSDYNSAKEDGIQRVQFGLQEEDIPIVADYDGDGYSDIAVRRPSNQFQYILRSSDNGITSLQFGLRETDIPLAAPVATRMAMAHNN